ncbi:discoidin domain-containing protein [Luteimonas panaciterrae]|uniref:discoidin domain-containing protein n=1 Tax=Luteimonas panaciterrae TaxID=363885 RepID=UPI003CCE3DE1
MLRIVSIVALTLSMATAHAQETISKRQLDGFDDTSAWRVVTSNQVTATLRKVESAQGDALCLDYDFNGVSGYAGIQRNLAIDYPENYAFSFRLRGDSPANDLQMKFIDASGDNVWWVNRPKYEFPKQWTEVRYKKRHIDKAWGPDPDRVLRRSTKLEFTIYNSAGGKGSVCFDDLEMELLSKQDDSPLRGDATATVSAAGAGNAIDGKPETAWQVALNENPALTLDLGRVREFGGLVLNWMPGTFVPDYRVLVSDDGNGWREVREVRRSNGGRDDIALPESEARYLRLVLEPAAGREAALAEIAVQPLSYAAIPNDFIKSVAANSPRGWYPRGFSGEQPYWTIVGIDGGLEQGLIGEDGAIEVGKGGFSIEPFVLDAGKLVTWNDVETSQSLRDGYLPIPTATWKHAAFTLETTAFVQGDAPSSQLVARYKLTNTASQSRKIALALAVRPLQVNPPSQFLNTIGGFSPITTLHVGERAVEIDGKVRVRALQSADAHFSQTFDEGIAVERLTEEYPRVSAAVKDPTKLASGAWVYELQLAPGESREFSWVAPLTGDFPDVAHFDAARALADVSAQWHGKLDRVQIQVPAQGQDLIDTLRTATAHMLISRIGPRLQPGTRSYARSWIRDGAMISEGLLRMAREDVVRDYVDWYAPFQFNDGMVPCCVDSRGSDPVPENDSHGELIFNIAELYRYDGDKAFLQKMWPHVVGAFDYMEKLRLSERTEANRAKNPAFYGMMPVSISHEGYSAKPMHSYWDNFWALRGYKDAVEIAQWLGKPEDAKRFAASRDQFRDDLYVSLQAAAKLHKIDYLPGSAELGDFDPTSTTIALAPGGEQGRLPPDLLRNGFERYWREFVQRRDGKREWKDYTPYEWRNVAAFVRLGWRERAWEAIEFFFKDRAPQAWNQWAEVVSHTPRKPFFVGDLPHAWVASDFVRSALDMFAYTREIDDSLVLAAGVPADWLDGGGIEVRDMRTAQGELSYSLRKDSDGGVTLEISEGLRLPQGGLVLPWPYAGTPGNTTINGKPASWQDNELRIHELPAKVKIAGK